MSKTVVPFPRARTIGDDFRALAERADRGEIALFALAIVTKGYSCERHVNITRNASELAMLNGTLSVIQAKFTSRVIEDEMVVSIDGEEV